MKEQCTNRFFNWKCIIHASKQLPSQIPVNLILFGSFFINLLWFNSVSILSKLPLLQFFLLSKYFCKLYYQYLSKLHVWLWKNIILKPILPLLIQLLWNLVICVKRSFSSKYGETVKVGKLGEDFHFCSSFNLKFKMSSAD